MPTPSRMSAMSLFHHRNRQEQSAVCEKVPSLPSPRVLMVESVHKQDDSAAAREGDCDRSADGVDEGDQDQDEGGAARAGHG